MKNNKGYEMKILNYLPNGKIDVIFPASGYIARSRSYHSFKKGLIKDKLSPSLRGIGIIGEESSVDEFGNKTEEYDKWSSMINRTYCDKVDGEWISIDGSYVSEEFRYFSKFKEWYNENKYEIPGERMVISKMVVGEKKEWSSYAAEDKLNEWKEKNIENYEFKTDEEKEEFEDLAKNLINAALECSSSEQWAWEYVNGEYNDEISNFDVDYWEWMYEIGDVISRRAYAFLTGLKMASEQLKNKGDSI